MSIYEKLIKVQFELKAPKSQYNGFGRYNYRNCEDILEAVKPLLKENGLTLHLYDDIVLIGDRYYIKAVAKLICVEDGTSIENMAFAREEAEKKGMDGSQITGASSSYARKYALNGLFLIDDTKDSDTTNQYGKEHQQPQQQKPETQQTSQQTLKVNNRKVAKAQVTKLMALAQSKGYSVEEVKTVSNKKFNKLDLYTLTVDEYQIMIKGFEGLEKREVK